MTADYFPVLVLLFILSVLKESDEIVRNSSDTYYQNCVGASNIPYATVREFSSCILPEENDVTYNVKVSIFCMQKTRGSTYENGTLNNQVMVLLKLFSPEDAEKVKKITIGADVNEYAWQLQKVLCRYDHLTITQRTCSREGKLNFLHLDQLVNKFKFIEIEDNDESNNALKTTILCLMMNKKVILENGELNPDFTLIDRTNNQETSDVDKKAYEYLKNKPANNDTKEYAYELAQEYILYRKDYLKRIYGNGPGLNLKIEESARKGSLIF